MDKTGWMENWGGFIGAEEIDTTGFATGMGDG